MRWHVNCLNIYDIDKNKIFFVICVVEWFMDYELNNMNLVNYLKNVSEKYDIWYSLFFYK